MSSKGKKTKAQRLRSRKRWLICSGIALLLIAVGIALWIFLRPIPIKAIDFETESLSLKAGESLTLSYTYAPEDATKTELSFKTSNRKVATVQDGVLTALSEGSCYISVTAESGAKDTIHVTVEAPMMARESLLVGDWVIFAVQEDGELRYVYNDPSSLSLLEDRSGSLTYGKTGYIFPDWRYTESIVGYDCYTVQAEGEEDLTLYYCNDAGSAYENCLMLSLPDGKLLLFRRLPSEE